LRYINILLFYMHLENKIKANCIIDENLNSKLSQNQICVGTTVIYFIFLWNKKYLLIFLGINNLIRLSNILNLDDINSNIIRESKIVYNIGI